ncbi:MAG: FAD:protein FMN transferase [Acidobacteria bacterium]|nr:FAD:protein FMN transferase [Acidobacteriota bacterium]
MRVRVGPKAGVLVTLLAAAVACRSPAQPTATMVEERRLAMGSEVHLTALTADQPRARAAFAAVFAEFERLEARLSVWRPGSDSARMNEAAGGEPVAVDADTRAVLRAAEQVSAWTDGAFDITFGALAEIWKFDHDQDNRLPSPDEIARRLPRVDHRAVVIDEARGTASITRPGVVVHLGGIGKGYAVDQAVAILRAAGLTDFMVQAGGDLYVAGTAGATPWRLGIQDPRGPAGESFALVELSDATFSTSGDYERYFERDGVRYHHLIDPSTGQPARGTRSVTIVTREATWADGLSTGVFILGPERGMALVERLPGVEAVIVTAASEVRVSSGLRGKVVITKPPTP